jgi:hypothetical protein
LSNTPQADPGGAFASTGRSLYSGTLTRVILLEVLQLRAATGRIYSSGHFSQYVDVFLLQIVGWIRVN